MTHPESIITSLEMCRKLKEVGWPDDECCHLWVKIKGHRFVASNYLFQKEPNPERWADPEEVHAAPTASEIIRRIPVADRIAVPTDRLDDPDSWAEIYCALQPTDLR